MTSLVDVLTVTTATLVSIAVTPANPSIAKGLTDQFTATGTYSDTSTQNLTSTATWSSGTTTTATITSGTGGEVATGWSRDQQHHGDVWAAVTSPADVLTVTAATLQSIAVTPANPSIAKGATQQFTATGTYTDSTTANITSSGDVDFSDDHDGDDHHRRRPGDGVGVGTSNITASLNGSDVSSADVLTVTAATLQSIAVTPANPTIAKGLTQQFTATGTYSDNSTQNITSTVTWTSGPRQRRRSPAAPAWRATGVGVGTSNITASLSGVTSPIDVLTVTAATLQSIAVTPASPSIAKGATQQFVATGTYSDNSTQTITSSVTWTSATTTTATITSGTGWRSSGGVGVGNEQHYGEPERSDLSSGRADGDGGDVAVDRGHANEFVDRQGADAAVHGDRNV